MKKLITFLCLIELVSIAQAQTKIGFRAGLNLSDQTNVYSESLLNGGTKYYNGQELTGFQGGAIFLEQNMSKYFLIRSQLLYSQQGFKTPELTDYNGNVIALKTTYRLNYINLPIQFLYSPSFSVGKPWIGLGGYIGYLINGKITNTQETASLQFGAFNSIYNRIDLGISSTAGFIFKNGIMAGIDYQLGLINVASSGSAIAGQNEKLKNRTWSFYAGYEFTLK